jgi:hypothetical protein
LRSRSADTGRRVAVRSRLQQCPCQQDWNSGLQGS